MRGLFWMEGIVEDQAQGWKRKTKSIFWWLRNVTCDGGTLCVFGITAHYEELNTHRGRNRGRRIKLVCNLKKSYITLHLRSEGNTCQLDRFVIGIKCNNMYMCVLKNIKYFTNRRGLLLLVGDWAKKKKNTRTHFDQSMTCSEVSEQSPTMAHRWSFLSCALERSLCLTTKKSVGMSRDGNDCTS